MGWRRYLGGLINDDQVEDQGPQIFLEGGGEGAAHHVGRLQHFLYRLLLPLALLLGQSSQLRSQRLPLRVVLPSSPLRLKPP